MAMVAVARGAWCALVFAVMATSAPVLLVVEAMSEPKPKEYREKIIERLPLLTAYQAAHYLHVNLRRLGMFVRDEELPLPFVDLGRKYFRKEDIDAWVEKRVRQRSTSKQPLKSGGVDLLPINESTANPLEHEMKKRLEKLRSNCTQRSSLQDAKITSNQKNQTTPRPKS